MYLSMYIIYVHIYYTVVQKIFMYIYIYTFICILYIRKCMCVYIHTRNLCRLPGSMHKVLTPFLLHPVQRHRQRGTRSGGVEGKIVEGGGAAV